jgi:hypothetical protein
MSKSVARDTDRADSDLALLVIFCVLAPRLAPGATGG